jgi:SAM-dependent methyltransferase
MRLLNSIPNVEWHVTQTISILNIATMDHLGFWLNREYGKTPHHNYVLYPDYLSLAALTPAYKDWLKDEFSKKLNAQQYRDLVAKLEIQYDPELTVKAHQFITEVDASRGLDYRQYLPNLARVFHDLNRQYYLDTINTHFKWCKDSTVLEIGPYYGEHTRLIASHDPKSVTLVEYNQSAVETLQSEFNNYEVVYADVHDFLKTSRHFDVVVCCGVLYHLHSPIHLLELIVNRATPNTVILESVSPLDAICIDEEDNTPGMRYVDTEWKSAHCSFIPPFSVIIKAMESMGYSTVEHRTSGYAGVTSKEMVQTAVFIKK